MTMTRARWANQLLWTLKLIAILFFIRAGWSKLAGAERQVILFDQIGWGDGFRYVTGVLEIAGSLLLLPKKTHALGTLVLLGIALGALASLFALGLPIWPGAIAIAWTGGIAILLRDQIAALARTILGYPDKKSGRASL